MDPAGREDDMAQETASFKNDIYSLVGYEVVDRNNKKIGKSEGHLAG